MSFFCKTSTPDEWKRIIAAVGLVTDEATFFATPEGLTFASMDRAHFFLVKVGFPNSAFEKYECEKPITFAARTDDLKKIIARVGPKDSIELNSKEGEELTFKFTSEKGQAREFGIHLIETIAKEAPTPNIEFESKMMLPVEFLLGVIEDIGTVAENLRVSTKPESVTFSGKGELGHASQEYAKDSLMVSAFEVTAPSQASYKVEQLGPFIKAMKGIELAKLEMSDRKPMRLLLDLNKQGATLTYFTAPVIGEKR